MDSRSTPACWEAVLSLEQQGFFPKHPFDAHIFISGFVIDWAEWLFIVSIRKWTLATLFLTRLKIYWLSLYWQNIWWRAQWRQMHELIKTTLFVVNHYKNHYKREYLRISVLCFQLEFCDFVSYWSNFLHKALHFDSEYKQSITFVVSYWTTSSIADVYVRLNQLRCIYYGKIVYE